MNITIPLPEKFLEILSQNTELQTSTIWNFTQFIPWLNDNKVVFFPEYTDHTGQHVFEVIETAEFLITEKTKDILTPEDVSVLLLSILLHDCGMHIGEEGFLKLISKENKNRVNRFEKDLDWSILWEEYLQEATRFDERTLNKLFGNKSPIHRPANDFREWKKTDYLLIGDFLRRYHSRLSYEIAIFGVPGPSEDHLSIGNISINIKELAGFVARSHGYPLRESIDLLNRKELRQTFGVHVPYLMALLRISDYMQVQKERANENFLKIRTLISPLSQREWKGHLAISDINFTQDDPELLYIIAFPQDVETFLKVKSLLKDIQRELDEAWAVLGEVYGLSPILKELGINIRRIKCNLDDLAEFTKTVNYIPDLIKFDSAGSDLLKLLIEPLYGNNPSYGIRELLQNSVDACLEFDDFVIQRPDFSKVKRIDIESEVEVSVSRDDQKNVKLTIKDKGIGMKSEVIKNYFLKAGASFRMSDAWKKQHLDKEGHSKVLRTGRFGIGVLAAFLIGSKLSVKTRHVTSDVGLEFECNIDDESIEIRRLDMPVGTIIEILVDESSYSLLNLNRWEDIDWYCLSYPRVTYKVGNSLYKQQLQIFGKGEVLSNGFHRITNTEFDDVQWSYAGIINKLICNGFRITDNINHYNQLFDGENQYILPGISVFDPDGKLQLNLQRNSTVGELSFKSELKQGIIQDFIAYLLTRKNIDDFFKFWDGIDYPAFRGYRTNYLIKVVFTPKGYFYLNSNIFNKIKISKILITKSTTEFDMHKMALEGNNVMGFNFPGWEYQGRLRWLRFLLDYDNYSGELGILKNLKFAGSRILIKKLWYEELINTNKISKFAWQNSLIEKEGTDWIVLKVGNCDKDSILLKDKIHDYSLVNTDNKEIAIAELYLNENSFEGLSENELYKEWFKLVPTYTIPYNFEERKMILKESFTYLENFLRNHVE